MLVHFGVKIGASASVSHLLPVTLLISVPEKSQCLMSTRPTLANDAHDGRLISHSQGPRLYQTSLNAVEFPVARGMAFREPLWICNMILPLRCLQVQIATFPRTDASSIPDSVDLRARGAGPATLSHSCIVCGFFHATIAEVSSGKEACGLHRLNSLAAR